jgi:hypothetical protein
MNIFILDPRPAEAAQMLCNRHVVKMIVESAQIMATVHHRYGGTATYRSTHEHHPCTIWAGESAHNYAWLLAHAKAMCHEYTLRYERRHKTEHYVFGELHHLPPGIPMIGQTPFAQAMPDQYRDIDPVLAYRRYYLGSKAEICKWTNREVPAWFEYQQPELEV